MFEAKLPDGRFEVCNKKPLYCYPTLCTNMFVSEKADNTALVSDCC